jgi:biopolymer transport protein ExbD
MRPRRLKNEINVVPYIDVMLVLLVIFMVTAPMMTTASIDVPSVGKAAQTKDGRPARRRHRRRQAESGSPREVRGQARESR